MPKRQSTSEFERAGKLIRIMQRKQRMDMSLAEARAWSQGEGAKMSRLETGGWFSTWFWAWTWAKETAMREEVKVRPFVEQSWAEVWTQKEAKVWAQARNGWRGCGGGKVWNESWPDDDGRAWENALARLEALVAVGKLALWVPAAKKTAAEAVARAYMRGEAGAVADALALAGVWVCVRWARARGEAYGRGENVPSGLADSATIRRILSEHHLRKTIIARHILHGSPEGRDEYSCIIDFIAPITRLPPELLRHIFLIIIDEASRPPSVLTLVCQDWYAIVTSIWASLKLGTRTPINAVTRKLERNQWLDIVVDTNSDRGSLTPSDSAFEAIFAAIEASSRWRSFVVESFPVQADLHADLVNHGLQRCPNVPMSRFTTFKIKSACETSPLLNGLLRILGTTARALTTVEINSANVVSSLASAYLSIFHSVKVLTLDTPGILNPVDLLPHLHQLETFTASHISFPIYHDDVDLPFIRTLRHLSLRAVSIQWMSGRTFHVLEHCTLSFPLHQHVLHTFSTTLPNCEHLTFQGYPLDILGGVSAPKLSHLSVVCSGSSNGRGSQQLGQLARQVLGESRLTPKSLHISIKASNQAWMNALVFMSDLEELIIHNARPSSLGAKVFRSLASHLGPRPVQGDVGAPLCPSLRRFGLKYDRWLRPSEQFDLVPVFTSIIRSRRHSNHSLESFRVWTTSGQTDPLELIERSQMSVEGFSRLADESGLKGDLVSYGVDANNPEAPANSNSRMRRVVQSFWNRRLG